MDGALTTMASGINDEVATDITVFQAGGAVTRMSWGHYPYFPFSVHLFAGERGTLPPEKSGLFGSRNGVVSRHPSGQGAMRGILCDPNDFGSMTW